MFKKKAVNGMRRGSLAVGCAAMALCGIGCQGSVNVPAPSTGDTVSFSADIQPIFNANCTTCHVSGGIASDRVHLTTTEAYDGLVNQASTQSDLTLVVPGDSSASLLFLKVSSDSPPVGGTMPLFGTPLSSANLGLIRDWIDQGALDN